MNGTTIANTLGGISLISVIGLAIAAGQYKERVDVLVTNQTQQQAILLEQHTLANEQKHIVKDLDNVQEQLKMLILELKKQTPQ